MSARIDKSWLVFLSIENFDHDRCVDLFSRPDGTHGFEEFRRDAEDRGAWDAGPVLLRKGVFLTGGRARGCKAIGGVVGGSNPAQSLGTKIAAANFKLKSAAQFGKNSGRPRRTPSGNGPSVWTGRALQAESDDLERLVLRFCIRPIDGAFELLAIMDIRARSISFASRPRRPRRAT